MENPHDREQAISGRGKVRCVVAYVQKERDIMEIVFSTGDSLLSRIIRWVTRSRVSHVGIKTTLHGVPIVMHAALGGVQVTPWSRYIRENRIVYRKEFPNPLQESNIRRATEAIGEKYDCIGLPGFLWVELCERFKIRAKNPLAVANAVVCSEYILSFDPKGEIIPEWKGLDPEGTTPEDLLVISERW